MLILKANFLLQSNDIQVSQTSNLKVEFGSKITMPNYKNVKTKIQYKFDAGDNTNQNYSRFLNNKLHLDPFFVKAMQTTPSLLHLTAQSIVKYNPSKKLFIKPKINPKIASIHKDYLLHKCTFEK